MAGVEVKVAFGFFKAHSGSKVYGGREWEGLAAGGPIRSAVMVDPPGNASPWAVIISFCLSAPETRSSLMRK